ncbi:unnamed protein product [Rotaria magnacalcarata]|uniref:NAD(+) ADP-ribosyltransferase n=1 Tax=Rotaria magnacalcarata TaxID=392030 RepID=A0A816K7C6_9BILA|nr:unnamed protein product [Rotaria magnacalcarata]CAF3939485.1 unnamed protein product [Rotaria magnacalcarata]
MNLSSKIAPCAMGFDVECRKIVDTAEIFSDNDGIYDCTLNKVDSNNVSIAYRMQLLKVNEQTKYYLFIDKSVGGQSLESFHSDIEVAKLKFSSIFHDLTGNYWHLKQHFINIPGHYEYIYPNELNSSSNSEEEQVGLNQINNIPKFHGGERAFFNVESNMIEKTYTYVNSGHDWQIVLPKIPQENTIIKSLLNIRKSILRIGILYEHRSTSQMFFGSGCLLTDELILTYAHNFDVIQWGNEKIPYSRIYVCLCDPAPETIFSLSNRNELLTEASLIRCGLLQDNLSEYDRVNSVMVDLAILKLHKPIQHLHRYEFVQPRFNSPLFKFNSSPINSKLYLVCYNGELVEDSDLKPYKYVRGFANITTNQLNFSHNANYKSVSIGSIINLQESSQETTYVTHTCSTLPGSSGGVLLDADGNFTGIHIGIANSRQSKNQEMFFK